MAKEDQRYSARAFGFLDFLWRWLGALVLVLATWNPSGHSYVGWARHALADGELGAVHFLVGAVLLAGWVMFAVATKNSLGSVGIVVGAAVIGTLIWFLSDIGLVHAGSASAIAWLALVALATLLAVGLSWSHVWRRLSGQLEVDSND
jgi:hypothetical protein